MKIRKLLTLLAAATISMVGSADEPAKTITEAFKNGKTKGTIGVYFESTMEDADNKDKAWATGYIYLKHETAEWNRLKVGIGFFGHNQLYNEFDSGVSNGYKSDIETRYTMPEAYIKAALTEKSSFTVGRWNHKKISHIDDAQSEGAYFRVKDIPNVDIIAGFMQRYAEIDYDDGEDFGRLNDKQDLGADDSTDDFLLFLEGRVKLAEDMLKLNPYVMHQGDYASVFGMDTDVTVKSGDMKFGGRVDFYHVSSDVSGTTDSTNYAIAPYVSVGPVTATLGYAQFDQDGSSKTALNKPSWLKDYLVGELDQDKPYGNSDCSVIFGKVKAKFGAFWAHIAYGQYSYDVSGSQGDGSDEIELQLGYKFTKNCDINLRLFDVQYDNVTDEDYQKVEARVRFKF